MLWLTKKLEDMDLMEIMLAVFVGVICFILITFGVGLVKLVWQM